MFAQVQVFHFQRPDLAREGLFVGAERREGRDGGRALAGDERGRRRNARVDVEDEAHERIVRDGPRLEERVIDRDAQAGVDDELEEAADDDVAGAAVVSGLLRHQFTALSN